MERVCVGKNIVLFTIQLYIIVTYIVYGNRVGEPCRKHNLFGICRAAVVGWILDPPYLDPPYLDPLSIPLYLDPPYLDLSGSMGE